VREPDGLALSSRNVYLSGEERAQALVLSRAVRRVEEMVARGVRDRRVLIDAADEIFRAASAVRVDYIELVDWSTLLPVETAGPGTLFAVAAFVGTTRLIDNIIIN
jgi:pantoate--beta-alanine ligase